MVLFKTPFLPLTLTILLKWMLLELDSKLHKRIHFFFQLMLFSTNDSNTDATFSPTKATQRTKYQILEKQTQHLKVFVVIFLFLIQMLLSLKEWPTCFILYLLTFHTLHAYHFLQPPNTPQILTAKNRYLQRTAWKYHVGYHQSSLPILCFWLHCYIIFVKTFVTTL